MTGGVEQPAGAPPPAPEPPPPEPVVVRARAGISLVWIVPLVAALIGAILAWQSYTNRGVPITITFDDAEGLEADKTRILFKAVEVGTVDEIELTGDLAAIRVRATMVRAMEPHLGEGSRFWVVRPRVGFEGVSGLSTILSGAYVAFEPGRGAPAHEFRGLEDPPLNPAGTRGLRIVLHAERLGSVGVGSPILHRDVVVGRVEAHRLVDDARIEITAFVDAQQQHLVRTTTRFWNASGLDLTLDANGIRLQAESLRTVIAGGIAFETPELERGDAAQDGAVYALFERQGDTAQEDLQGLPYVLYFSGSVRGLSPGAPVEFRGVEVGEVKAIRPEVDVDAAEVRIAVVMELSFRRTFEKGRMVEDPAEFVERLVANGLRARLETGSLLTGQMFVSLDFHDDAPASGLAPAPGGPEGARVFPTVPSTIEHVTDTAMELLARVGSLPIEEIAESLRSAVQGIEQVATAHETQELAGALRDAVDALGETARNVDAHTASLSAGLTDALAAARDTMERANAVVAEVDAALAADSPLRYQLARALEQMGEASRAVKELASFLERHPEALIQGKEGP